jgi:uridine phosphorylase
MARLSETDLILNPDGSVYHLNLLPKHISDTIITVGDPARVYRVSQYFDDIEFEMNKREFITHVGKYKGRRVTVISTGMGTDNIEIFFTELDALINVDLKTREVRNKKRKLKIVRIGTSASLQEDIPLDSHLVTEYAVGFDSLMNYYNLPADPLEATIAKDMQKKTGLAITPYVVRGSALLQGQYAPDMVVGNTITAPGFYAPQGREIRIPLKYPSLAAEFTRYYNKANDFRITNFEMETAGYYAMARLLGHDVVSVNAIIANRPQKQFSKDPNKVVDGLIRKVLSRI